MIRKIQALFHSLPTLHKEMLVMVVVSLVATITLFNDYLYPWKKVHFWSDTEGFHWPLLNYAFTTLKAGRFPLWDASMYSGIPFAGNLQAGLFYPPNWVMMLSQWHRSHLPFLAIETLVVAHIWMALAFSYCWLRLRAAHWLPAAMGAAVVGYSGYMLSQTTHLGVICGYAWMPFGLWGIEQANATGKWKPLWKLAVGLAMALLAGYPATFIAFLILASAYALTLQRRWSLLCGVTLATVVAVLLSAAQLFVTLETVSYKLPEKRFGGFPPDYPNFYLSFLLPNYYDQNRTTTGPEVATADYMYVGAAGLLGLLFLLRYPMAGWVRQALFVGAVFAVFLENPWELVTQLVFALPVLPDAMRSYNLLAGIAFPVGLLTVGAVDTFLRGKDNRAQPAPRAMVSWDSGIWAALALAWMIALLVIARKGGMEFGDGLSSGWYALGTVALLAVGLLLFRTRRQMLVAVVMLTLMFCEYRVFGVNRKFNAVTGDTDQNYLTDFRLGGRSFLGLDDAVFEQLRAHPDHRVAVFDAPHTTDMRHYGLSTAQGFDPFVTRQYKEAVERFHPFRTDRMFDMDPDRMEMLRTFGVGYMMVIKDTEMGERLRADDRFTLLAPSDSFFQILQVSEFPAAWRFDAGEVTVDLWTPERRVFTVNSNSGGTFALLEQNLPGWSVTIDGAEQPLGRWDGTFQSVQVPAGKHVIEFRYFSKALVWGAGISLITLLGGVFLIRRF